MCDVKFVTDTYKIHVGLYHFSVFIKINLLYVSYLRDSFKTWK